MDPDSIHLVLIFWSSLLWLSQLYQSDGYSPDPVKEAHKAQGLLGLYLLRWECPGASLVVYCCSH